MISLIINNIGGKNMSKLSVRDCIGSGYSSVLINTTEETRLRSACKQVLNMELSCLVGPVREAL